MGVGSAIAARTLNTSFSASARRSNMAKLDRRDPELLFSLTLTVDNRNRVCRCLLGKRVLSLPSLSLSLSLYNDNIDIAYRSPYRALSRSLLHLFKNIYLLSSSDCVFALVAIEWHTVPTQSRSVKEVGGKVPYIESLGKILAQVGNVGRKICVIDT